MSYRDIYIASFSWALMQIDDVCNITTSASFPGPALMYLAILIGLGLDRPGLGYVGAIDLCCE